MGANFGSEDWDNADGPKSVYNFNKNSIVFGSLCKAFWTARFVANIVTHIAAFGFVRQQVSQTATVSVKFQETLANTHNINILDMQLFGIQPKTKQNY